MKTAINNRGQYGIFDLFGPTVEFLSPPGDPEAVYCAMIGTIPPGGIVPLHSHADEEGFYLLSGSVEVWCDSEWKEAAAAQFVHVPANVKHAFRNRSKEPVVELILTTSRMGSFFERVGRPIAAGVRPGPPTAADLERFLKISNEYGYWNASPDENARIGIQI